MERHSTQITAHTSGLPCSLIRAGWYSLLLTLLICTGVRAETGVVPGRFVVKLSLRSQSDLESLAASAGHDLHRATPATNTNSKVGADQWLRVYSFHTTDSSMTSEDVAVLLGRSNVEYVEPEYFLELHELPSDPYFNDQWALNNTGQSYLAVERRPGPNNDLQIFKQGTAGNDINIAPYLDPPAAVSTHVVVGIIDTGVDVEHPDLQGRIWHNPDEIPGNGLDDDHNGYIDDVVGYDVSGDIQVPFDPIGDNDPGDSVGHGTHVAGIVGAARNDIGVVGVASEALIMPVKIFPNGTSLVGAAGIIYAVNSGAQVLNLSWGTSFEPLILRDAIRYARDNGVLVVSSAGNSGANDKFYPGSFEESYTVAASNSDGHLAFFSSFGSWVDLTAPGQDILSLRAQNTDLGAGSNEPGAYIVGDDSLLMLANGTSMSAPMVTGAAAFMWSVRPDITLDQMEAILSAGADDMLDPFNNGDTLIGPDTVTGAGHLNIAASLSLLMNGGIHFVEPIPMNRYVTTIPVRAAPVAGYAGGWQLDWSDDNGETWQSAGSGPSMPSDSLLAELTLPGRNGPVRLRLTDDFGIERFVSVILVSDQKLELVIPQEGQEYDYNIPVSGSVHGPAIDSVRLRYRGPSGPILRLYKTTKEFYDTLIYSWNASGIPLGEYTLYVDGYFGGTVLSDSVAFQIKSAFASGWPQQLTGRGGLTPVCADLNNDGDKEIIAATEFGVNAFHSDGTPVAGFPVILETDARGVPAVYDVDHDGENEIIVAAEDGLHVFNYDGSYVPGWPVACRTERTGYGYPVPSVVELGPDHDSAIVIINNYGDLLAYQFNGDSYFYSLEGWFGSIANRDIGSDFFNGNAITSVDLDGDAQSEVVVSYAGTPPFGGVAIYDSRTGQPAYDRPVPHALKANTVYGSVLIDLNDDNLPEIITCGTDSSNEITLWVKTKGFEDYPGWPKRLDGLRTWLGSNPTVADLDNDGSPEILASFFEFGIAALYVFRADGEPYATIEGRPPGEVFLHLGTLGVPVAANLVGDDRPEIVVRSGYLLPGTGRETIHILDQSFTPISGWPVNTPAPPSQVFFTPQAPLIDDIDNDGRVEVVFLSEDFNIYAWDFEADAMAGDNTARLYVDNKNSSLAKIVRIPTPVDDPLPALPSDYELAQNYPNPFNPSTTIRFSLPISSRAEMSVYNLLGQRVLTLIDQELPAGQYEVEFDGHTLASGVYFYRLKAGDYEASRKMVMVK